MSRFLKGLLWLVSGTVLLSIVLVLAIAMMDWNWARPWVNRQLSELTERTVQIDGALQVDWQRHAEYDGWRGVLPWPTVQAQDVTISNPSWASSGPVMAQARSLQARIDLLALTQRTVRLAELSVHDGLLNLERREDAVNNWTFGTDKPADPSSGWQVVAEQLVLDNASVRLLDASRDLDVTVQGNTSVNGEAQDFGTQWSAEGSFHGVPVRGEGQAGHVLALQGDERAFPVQANVDIGATTIKLEGSLTRPRNLAALDLQLELSGPTMADLYPILNLALPNTPPYRTEGRLRATLDRERAQWVYERFTGTVGKSDLSGTLTYEQQEPRPVLTGELSSDLLRLEDLGPLIGAPASDDVEQQGARQDGQLTQDTNQPDNKALPVEDADSRAWDVMDADVTFVGKRFISDADLPLDDLEAHVILSDSVLRFEPLNFGVAGGSLESVVTLDGTVEPIQVSLDAQARGLQLGKLFPGVESMDAALGAVHGDAHLTGHGNSVAAMMSHVSGDLSAVVSQGTVSRFLLEAAGLNVANMVFVKLFGDEQVSLQCLAAEFRIDDGLVQTRTFILETDDAVVTVDGQVNMTTEEMDLDVHPDNKSLRIFTLRSPLYVKGTFKDPDVGVQKGAVATRAGAAIALGVAATPLAALLPLLNIGTDDTTTCAAVDGGTTQSDSSSDDAHRLQGSVPGAQNTEPLER